MTRSAFIDVICDWTDFVWQSSNRREVWAESDSTKDRVPISQSDFVLKKLDLPRLPFSQFGKAATNDFAFNTPFGADFQSVAVLSVTGGLRHYAIVRKHLLNAKLKLLDETSASTLSFETEDGRYLVPKRELRRLQKVRLGGRAKWSLSMLSASLSAVLIVASFLAGSYRLSSHEHELDAKLDRERRVVAAIRARSAEQQEIQSAWQDRRAYLRSYPSDVDVLETLSVAFDGQTHLLQYAREHDTLQLTGIAADATQAVRKVGNADGLDSAQLTSPVVPSGTGNKMRFSMSARVVSP